MRRVAPILLSAWLFSFGSPVEAKLPPRSVSASRQFLVYGPDARLRGALCDLAEETKSAALRLLREQDAWRTPIVVHARYPVADLPELPPARLNFSQTVAGLKLQLDLTITSDVSAPAIERELLRAIYLEMIYRQQPDIPAGTPFVEPPDWLLDATLALADERNLADLVGSLRAATAAGPSVTLEEFLRQQPGLLESPSRTIYRAYSAALAALLIEKADGRTRLARFVADLTRAPTDPLADLQTHFPILGDNVEATEESWRRAIARWSASEPFRLLNCDETERTLAQTLQIILGNADHAQANYTLEEFPKFVDRPAAKEALRNLTQNLLTLSSRANPLYVPVIFEYEKIIAQLVRRKTKHVAERLAAARAMREHIGRTMEDIVDYMNWFEATQSQSASGVFREYLKAIEFGSDRKPQRHDRISVYLDAFEPLMEN